MRRSVCRRGSLLLQNIHRSLPVLQRLYEQSQPQIPVQGTGIGKNAATHSTFPKPICSSPASSSVFPPDPQNKEEGDETIVFFCQELGIGEKPLRLWRQKLKQRVQRRWRITEDDVKGNEANSSSEAEVPWMPVRVVTSSSSLPHSNAGSTRTITGANKQQSSTSTLWLRPRPQDVAVVQSAIRNLKFLVSPLLLLSPPPYITSGYTQGTSSPPLQSATKGGHTLPSQLLRPTNYEECSRWYATQPIPAGMFLMSIPTEAVLFANPPAASDPLLAFFMQVEELVAQLVDAAATEGAAHHGYATYLCDSVVPCKNLPFLKPAELRKTFEAEAAAKSGNVASNDHSAQLQIGLPSTEAPESGTTDRDDAAAVLDSPALSLLAFFHEDMSGEPLSDYLRSRLSKEAYAWWVSLVLAHRAGSSCLLPMIDKLNHSPLPNCYYTMATEETVCGLDVVDNLFAGVPEELLYQPYVHLFAIRDIAAGEELTLCYASAPEAAYRRAGTRPPPRPALLQGCPTASMPFGAQDERDDVSAYGGLDSDGGKHEKNTRRAADFERMQDVMEALFSHPTSAPAAAAATVLHTGDSSSSDKVATRRLLHELRYLLHPGQQEVNTAEGSASWRLQWGFVPPCDAVYSARDLMEVAGLVAERRVDTRTALFPVCPSASSPSSSTSSTTRSTASKDTSTHVQTRDSTEVSSLVRIQ